MATTSKKPQAKSKPAAKAAAPSKTAAVKSPNGAKAAVKPKVAPTKPAPVAPGKSAAAKPVDKASAKAQPAVAKPASKTSAKLAGAAAAKKAGGKGKTGKAAPPPPVEVYVSSFTVGNRVTHATFGEGKVLAVEGDQLTIKFASAEKVIIDSFVKAGPKG